MTQVLCETVRHTGRQKIKRGMFGPVVWLEVVVSAWDTNTGHDEPDCARWVKATNADIDEGRCIQTLTTKRKRGAA